MSRAGRHADAQPAAPASAPPAAERTIARLAAYLRLAIPIGGLFAAVYFASNWFSGQRSRIIITSPKGKRGRC